MVTQNSSASFLFNSFLCSESNPKSVTKYDVGLRVVGQADIELETFRTLCVTSATDR